VTDKNLRIDGQRLWDSLMEMAKIGPGVAGGNNRQTLTDADAEGRRLFAKWCAAEGLTMGIDQMGTMFARREGTDRQALPVYVGSHLDTQPTGGKYDGVLGVLGGLEIIRTLNEREIKTRHPIVVTNWTNEEGTRFAPAMLASGVFAGVLEQDWAYEIEDTKGKKFGDELERIGWRGEEEVGARKMHAFFELHIEQGPILEDEGFGIGVVTHAQGQRWYEINLTGMESHAGPTPMLKRKDALLGAARIVELVNEIGLGHLPGACATVGMIEAYPNSRNVIPGRAFLTVDFRHPEDKSLAAMDGALAEGVAQIARDTDLGYDLEQLFYFPPLEFDRSCVAAIRDAAERLGYRHRDIVSGAGHDACYLARVAPTGMVFSPCVDGISHNEAEDCKPEWVTRSANVLLHAVLDAAGITGPESHLVTGKSH